MKKLLFDLLDWIYKKKCYCCGSSKESVPICSNCYNTLDFNPPRVDRIILNTDIYVAGQYDKSMQKIIRGLKYHNKKELAYYQAKLMFDYFQTLNINKNFQVVPVPLHKSREKKRHYNHMELVADEFCKMSGFVKNTDLIKRIKQTKPQKTVLKLNKQNLKSRQLPILLIDDICTSGATFESIIEEFHKNEITDITCFATSSPCS